VLEVLRLKFGDIGLPAGELNILSGSDDSNLAAKYGRSDVLEFRHLCAFLDLA
jgi:hypothetical protein